MKKLICVIAIISLMFPCLCYSETPYERSVREDHERMVYGMPKADWDRYVEKHKQLRANHDQ